MSVDARSPTERLLEGLARADQTIARSERLLEVAHVAHRLSVSQEYVRRLIRSKRLLAIRLDGPRGHWRVKAVDLDAFIASRHATACNETEPRTH